MAGSMAACVRGRAWPSRSRTQGAAFFGGAKGKPEDADMRGATHVIRRAWLWSQSSQEPEAGMPLVRSSVATVSDG